MDPLANQMITVHMRDGKSHGIYAMPRYWRRFIEADSREATFAGTKVAYDHYGAPIVGGEASKEIVIFRSAIAAIEAPAGFMAAGEK